METMKIWIGGKWVASASGNAVWALNPATGQKIACLSRGGTPDVAKAEDAASRDSLQSVSFLMWRAGNNSGHTYRSVPPILLK